MKTLHSIKPEKTKRKIKFNSTTLNFGGTVSNLTFSVENLNQIINNATTTFHDTGNALTDYTVFGDTTRTYHINFDTTRWADDTWYNGNLQRIVIDA